MPASGKIGNKGGGRKTRGEELALVKWYESLLPEVFRIAQKMLLSQNKKDKLWAMDWLKGGLIKMIPQKIGGDPDNRTPIPISNVFVKNERIKKDDLNGGN